MSLNAVAGVYNTFAAFHIDEVDLHVFNCEQG